MYCKEITTIQPKEQKHHRGHREHHIALYFLGVVKRLGVLGGVLSMYCKELLLFSQKKQK